MTNDQPTRRARAGCRRGLTLVEMVISTLFVGVMLVAALNLVGASKHSQQKATQANRGNQLAQTLMAEILQQDYADPVDGPDSFGRSAAEDATGDRSLFDDVDDYDNWTAQPPQRKDGTVMSQLTDWKQVVIVQWTNPNSLNQNVNDNQPPLPVTMG